MKDPTSSEFESECYPIKGYLRYKFNEISQLEGERYGNTVRIGKSEWCLNIKRIVREDQNYLGCFVLCPSKFEDGMSILTSYTVNLIAQNETKKSLKCCHRFEKSVGWGWPTFIKWSDVLNDSSSDDSVILEAFISIESEFSVPRRTIDFQQNRPNVKDLENMLKNEQMDEVVVDTMQDTIILNEISEKDNLTNSFLINGLPCQLNVKKNKKENVEWLSIYLFINKESKSKWWMCKTSAELILKSHLKENKCLTLDITCFNVSQNNWGYTKFIRWEEFVDPQNGYVKNGKIQLETRVSFHGKSGMNRLTGKDYEKPVVKMTDAVIILKETKFQVSKPILAQQSKFFENLFRLEKNEYNITNVDIPVFKQFLEIVYNKDTIITEENLESLLKAVEMFNAPECYERIDVIRKKYPIENTMEMLKLVDKYPLPALQRNVLRKLKVDDNLESVIEDSIYKTLSSDLKVAILEWKLVSLSQRTEEPEPTKFAFSTDFEISSPHCDVVIEVMNFTYHASKQILANASEYFMKRFYGPQSSEESEIELYEVHPMQLEKLLTHIYHPSRPVTGASVDSLLQLAKQFSVPKLMDKCEEHLVLRFEMPLIDKLEYVAKYNLPFLMEKCIKLAEEEGVMEELKNNYKYNSLPFKVIGEMTKKMELKSKWT